MTANDRAPSISTGATMLSRSERDALVQQHTEYARALALRIAKTLPSVVSRDDLISVGISGLVEAAERFDPTRGVQFTTFAYYRIRGAVYDYVRQLASDDPYVRARASCALAVDQFIEDTLAERTRAVGEGPAEAAETLANVLETAATAFTVAECADALVSEGSRRNPEDEAGCKEALAAVRQALEKLPQKERTMVQGVYFEGLTIEETGAKLGLSKSWSSRLHARALALLREQMGLAGS